MLQSLLRSEASLAEGLKATVLEETREDEMVVHREMDEDTVEEEVPGRGDDEGLHQCNCRGACNCRQKAVPRKDPDSPILKRSHTNPPSEFRERHISPPSESCVDEGQADHAQAAYEHTARDLPPQRENYGMATATQEEPPQQKGMDILSHEMLYSGN